MTRTIAAFLSIGLGLAATGTGWAQDLIKPKTALPLRDGPPGSFFQSKGVQVGTADPNTTYVLLDQRVVPTITGKELWVKIKPSGSAGPEGWAYAGTSDLARSNFDRAR